MLVEFVGNTLNVGGLIAAQSVGGLGFLNPTAHLAHRPGVYAPALLHYATTHNTAAWSALFMVIEHANPDKAIAALDQSFQQLDRGEVTSTTSLRSGEGQLIRERVAKPLRAPSSPGGEVSITTRHGRCASR